ncbi:hypothetical protein ACS0TY_033525 [Phlomoides rotata]
MYLKRCSDLLVLRHALSPTQKRHKMDIDGGGEDAEVSSRQVQVRFVTNLKPPYKVPQASISIPANLTRFGLSALVNNLLQAANVEWKSEPFDFLIDGELVRMSLEEFLLAKGIFAEKVLEIEYIKAIVPRKEEDPSLHDDWVSAVDGSNDGYAFKSCKGVPSILYLQFMSSFAYIISCKHCL